MKACLKIIFLLITALLLTGCSDPVRQQTELRAELESYADEKIVISGLQDKDFEISVAELMEFDTVTKSAASNTADGQQVKVKITGPLLNTFLQKYGKSQRDFSVVRFSARDKYSIAVVSDILANRDIILGFMDKGKALIGEDRPVRVVIPEERAMYWVRMLNRIDFETGESARLAEKIIFLETASEYLPQEDYEYYERPDKVIKTRDLIGKYADINDTAIKNVFMVAADGLKKNETRANFLDGYLKITGSDIPKFLSPDLPQGMHVRDLLSISYGTTAFFSAAQALNVFPLLSVGEEMGFAFTDLLKQIGTTKAVSYRFTPTDGQSVLLSISETANAGICMGSDGAVSFVSGSPANKTVNKLLSIEVIE